MSKLLPGERVLWEGRPHWRAVARDVMHVGWVVAYFAAVLAWDTVSGRMAGLGLAATLLAEIPLLLAGAAVAATCVGFAYAVARTTTYTVTSQRCILRYGVALTATLSLPLRRVAAVSVADRDGGGDIPLRLKPGTPVRYLKLWPHVRPWRFSAAEPMLRGVADPVAVAELISHAAAQLSPGVLHAAPDAAGAPVVAATLSPAGD